MEIDLVTTNLEVLCFKYYYFNNLSEWNKHQNSSKCNIMCNMRQMDLETCMLMFCLLVYITIINSAVHVIFFFSEKVYIFLTMLIGGM